jgi:hypothetical protein
MFSRFRMILLAATLCGCASPTFTNNDVFAFKSAVEKGQFERRALAGDIVAARRLTDYYLFLQYDLRSALYWAKIGASHGDSESAKSVRSIREILREQNQ